MKRSASFLGILGCGLLSISSAKAQSRVVGGQVSKTCAWPAVTKPASPMAYEALEFLEPGTREKVQLCSGTLVHPRVVVYAAHCLKAGYLRLGEDRNGPLLTLKDGDFEKTNTNPRWTSPSQVAEDWAYLVLKKPIKGVPLIPLAYGCELDMLVKPGAPVMFAGYSDNEKGLPEDQRDFRQKWARTKIRDATAGVINAGGNGVVACKGDSGGPLLAEVPDGSWRMIGIASTRAGSSCESPQSFNRYSRVRKAMVAWLESETGIDLTPCFDLDGKPTPSAACDAFMAYAGDPMNPKGTWSNNCAGANVRPAKDACGIEDSGEEPQPEPEPEPEEPEGEPKDPGEEPKDPGGDPKDPGDEPKDPEGEPKDPGEEPKDSGDEPKDSGDEPKDSGDEPKDSGDGPKDPEDLPKDSGDESKGSGNTPKASGDKPNESGGIPDEPNEPNAPKLPGIDEPEPAKGSGCELTALDASWSWLGLGVVLAGLGRRRRSRSSPRAFGGSLANRG